MVVLCITESGEVNRFVRLALRGQKRLEVFTGSPSSATAPLQSSQFGTAAVARHLKQDKEDKTKRCFWTSYTGGIRKTDHDSRPVQKRRRDKMNNVISELIE